MSSHTVALLNGKDLKPEIFKAFKQNEFDELYHHTGPQRKKYSETVKNKLRSKFSLPHLIFSLFPSLNWLLNYKWKEDFLDDIMAGFTVAVLHIPQGMAYSSLGAVPPIVGIYMAVFPVIIYIFMGTSRHISMGTFSVVCMMTSKAVLTYSDPRCFNIETNCSALAITSLNNSQAIPGLSPVQVASAVCITVGIWHIILGTFQLGSLSVLMSDIMISGFTTGAAVLVMVSQVKHMFGVKLVQFTGPFNVLFTIQDLLAKLEKTNYVALGVVLILTTILIIYNDYLKASVQKRIPFPIPTEMMVIVAGTLLSSTFDLKNKFNLSTVGNIPIGLPTPRPPPFFLIPKLILDGLLISIIAFSINISMASILAKKKYKVDSNQELLASGVANIFGSFFSCIPFASSLSRSLIQLQTGGKTQLASGVSCGFLVLILLFVGPFFEPLPNCVLTGIVFAAVKGMFKQINDLKVALKESYAEACVWLVTFLGVVFLDVDYGLGLGVVISLIFVVVTGQKVMLYHLGNVANTTIYIEQEFYESAVELKHMVILKVVGGINFVNKSHLFSKIAKISAKSQARNVILDLSSVSSIDRSTVKAFTYLFKELREQEVNLHLVKLLEPVKKVFIKCNYFCDFPVSQLYPSVHDAVLNCS